MEPKCMLCLQHLATRPCKNQINVFEMERHVVQSIFSSLLRRLRSYTPGSLIPSTVRFTAQKHSLFHIYSHFFL
jgi:hypothetical protein